MSIAIYLFIQRYSIRSTCACAGRLYSYIWKSINRPKIIKRPHLTFWFVVSRRRVANKKTCTSYYVYKSEGHASERDNRLWLYIWLLVSLFLSPIYPPKISTTAFIHYIFPYNMYESGFNYILCVFTMFVSYSFSIKEDVTNMLYYNFDKCSHSTIII